MKRKALISMFAAMVTLALSMSAVACGISDDEDDSSSEEQHVHVLTAVDATAASCTAEGNKAYYICECGKLFEDADATTETSAETVKIAKLDHAYGNWNVTVKATCTAIGSREKVCSACNNKVTEEIPALGHDEITHTPGKTQPVPKTAGTHTLPVRAVVILLIRKFLRSDTIIGRWSEFPQHITKKV